MIPDAIEVRLKPKERAVLESRLRAATTEQRQLLRIRIVLEAADGSGTREIARELDTTPTTVSLWRGGVVPEKLGGVGGVPPSRAPPTYTRTTDPRRPAALAWPPPPSPSPWVPPPVSAGPG